MEKKKKRLQSEDVREQIEADFEEIHNRLKSIESIYNPEHLNLHFDALQRADVELYKELSILSREGLEKVKQHGKYFSSHTPLYNDGMFWYDLFLVISAVALRINIDRKQMEIPQDIVTELVENLVEISAYSAVHRGDIVKRNHEALGNTLIAFFSKELLELVNRKKETISSDKAKELIEQSIKSAKELLRKENKG